MTSLTKIAHSHALSSSSPPVLSSLALMHVPDTFTYLGIRALTPPAREKHPGFPNSALRWHHCFHSKHTPAPSTSRLLRLTSLSPEIHLRSRATSYPVISTHGTSARSPVLSGPDLCPLTWRKLWGSPGFWLVHVQPCNGSRCLRYLFLICPLPLHFSFTHSP